MRIGAAAVAACMLVWGGAARAGEDTIFQYSTIDALVAGVYDGEMTFAELARHGDLGLGTFNALDGEMLAFDGVFWRITHDGKVHAVPPEALTPFATVTPFEADTSFALEGDLDMTALAALLDSHLADRNTPVAVRIDGIFTALTIRAPERQQKPYPGLAEALKSQNTWQHDDIEGTMVGFWFPAWMASLDPPVWHLHFLSADQTVGGHVLALEIGAVTVGLDPSPDMALVLPRTQAFADAEISP
jgi:acetolactate decarboxylase